MSIKPTADGRPGVGVRFQAWLRRHDRIRVTIGDWPATSPPVTVRLMAFWRWLILLVMVTLSIAVVVWVFFVKDDDLLLLISVLLLCNFVVLSLRGPMSHEWTDRLVAPAIAAAAKDLGTEVSHNVWRLDPDRVGGLAANLVELAALEKVRNLGRARVTDLDHERAVIKTAGPTLLPYLRPRLTAAEHGNEPLGIAEAASPTPEAWPTLPGQDEPWQQPRADS